MCTRNRKPVFVDPAIVRFIEGEFLRTAAHHGFAVVAYTFMPDHLHALLEGESDDADLRRCLMVFRRRATAACKRAVPLGLWQDGYYDRVLRRDEDTPAVITYILNNPVRSGLVNDPLEYPFSWSCDLPPKHAALRSRAPWV